MSTPLSSEAIVLRTVAYSDTSLIVRLFTEEQGKVSVIAKGARRPKQPAAGILQIPNHITVWYHHKDGREVQTLTKCEFVERYPALTSDLARSAAALVAVEMLDRAVQDADAHPLLFRLISATLRQLNSTNGRAMVILHFFQLHLARQLGFAPGLASCTNCGREMASASLDPITGATLCSHCRTPDGIQLDGAALEHLRDLEGTHISQLDTLSPPKQASTQVGRYLLNHLFCHVEGMSNLRSIRFWQRVAA